MVLGDLPHLETRAIIVALGLIWGSFLNVVIHRVPREMSLVRPGSSCPHCKKPIAAWNNIPVVSWLLLRGRSRCCKKPISARYPIVELLGGFAALGVWDRVVMRLGHDTSLSRAAAFFTADFALTLGLIAAAFIDFEHMFLPDAITIGGALLGIGTASLRGFSFGESIVGALVGFLGVYVPFTFLYRRILGRTGMGIGDAKLMALAGAWFGVIGALLVLFGGAIQGVAAAGALYLARGKIEEPEAVRRDRKKLQKLAKKGDKEAQKLLDADPVLGEDARAGLGRMPFGPFLILAILELLFFGPEIHAVIGAYLLW